MEDIDTLNHMCNGITTMVAAQPLTEWLLNQWKGVSEHRDRQKYKNH